MLSIFFACPSTIVPLQLSLSQLLMSHFITAVPVSIVHSPVFRILLIEISDEAFDASGPDIVMDEDAVDVLMNHSTLTELVCMNLSTYSRPDSHVYLTKIDSGYLQDLISRLVSSYEGLIPICRLVASWLTEVRSIIPTPDLLTDDAEVVQTEEPHSYSDEVDNKVRSFKKNKE